MLKVAEDGQYPEVFAFASHMHERLEFHSDKDTASWCGDSPESLLARVEEELDELKDAVANSAGFLLVIREAADVANMAMMVADVYYDRAVNGPRVRNTEED